MKSPDQICGEYSDKKVKVTIRHLDNDNVLIEGNPEALQFLGNLLIAQSNFDDDCSFQISPDGAGCSLFSDRSSLGIYIHRLPCEHGEIDNEK